MHAYSLIISSKLPVERKKEEKDLLVRKKSRTFVRCLEEVCIGIDKKEKKMSKICQITGKKAMVGNNVSHSRRRTKRLFNVNLFTKKFFYVEEDCWISLKLSASGLRYINKVGLDAALKNAVDKGYITWNDIKVVE